MIWKIEFQSLKVKSKNWITQSRPMINFKETYEWNIKELGDIIKKQNL